MIFNVNESQIDEIFKAWTEVEGPGGQIVVTHKGKTIFEKCYGYANLELKIPMTQESVFHVASVSKMFTAMSICMLHERGLINIHDDVRKYIPELISFEEPLTIKQMMNHVSGMPEHYELMYLNGRKHEDVLCQNEMLKLIARQKTLNFAPGDEFQYSNPNYMLMTAILNKVTGMSLKEFTRQNIFEPLGMTHSFFRDDPHVLVPNKVNSYHDDGYHFSNAILSFGIHGPTCLQTTARDLAKWMRQYMEPTLVSRETMDTLILTVPELGKGGKTIYGGGIRIQNLEGHPYYHHGGVNAGYRTWGVVFPEDELVLTLFTNTYILPIERAGRDLARLLLGLPARTPKTLETYRTETVDMDSIAGLYYCHANGDNFNIKVNNGVVYHGSTPLVHLGGNLFKQGRKELEFAFGPETYVLEGSTVTQLVKLENQLPQEQALEYVGEYYADPVQSHFAVGYDEGKLWLDHIRFDRAPLHWLEGDTFFTGMKKITFTRDENGKVNGYIYKSSQLRRMPYQKIR